MSIVIIGGHDRMVRQYETICKKHNCKAKIFTQMPSCLNKKIGNPDLVVLFTNTVSHKMVRCAVSEAKNKNIEVVRSHSSSRAALTEILEQRCEIAPFIFHNILVFRKLIGIPYYICVLKDNCPIHPIPDQFGYQMK